MVLRNETGIMNRMEDVNESAEKAQRVPFADANRVPFWLVHCHGQFFHFLVILFGTSGYMTLEGWSFIESVYMVIITLSTVGFMEVRPLSNVSRVMTILVIFGGVGAFFYLGGSLAQMFVEGKFQNLLGRRRVQKIIDELDGHYIVCGYGRIGRVVAQGIKKKGSTL